jgi:pimeloyl-ACP methyl ester carboxylesterase
MPLYVHGIGDRDGIPIVVLPCFSLDHVAMASVFEPVLSQRPDSWRLYLDLPGTGRSPSGEPRSDAVLSEVQKAIESKLGDRPFLVAGWSYGGYLAIGLARRTPRVVRGLLVVCAGQKIRPGDRNLQGVVSSTPESGWLDEIPSQLHDHFRLAIGLQTAAAAKRVAATLALNGPTDEPYLNSLRTEGFALSDEDSPARYHGPAALLSGRSDRIAGYRDIFAAVDRFPGATCIAVADAGHYLPLEQPAVFKSTIRLWLSLCPDRDFADWQ